jgi:hypothetical protein
MSSIGKGKVIRDFRDLGNKACTAVGLDGLILHEFRRTVVEKSFARSARACGDDDLRSQDQECRYNIVSEDDLKQAALKTWAHVQAQTSTRKVISLSPRPL